ncbi:MAG: metallopeptidase family protein [Bryobacteraceae bacterium]
MPVLLLAYNGPRMSPQEFDKLVERAVRSIPPRFRRRLDNVAFVVEREPPRPGLLGLYEGRPLPTRSVSDGFTMPDRITIFQGPHERMARDSLHLERLLKDTVWHEVAHHFGMDEARVRRAERRRARLSSR